MTTTPTHDSAQTWRDLADALTPHQIAYIEDWESRPDEPPAADGIPRPLEHHRAVLLSLAREYAGQNAAAALYADIAPPPEDGQHWHWEDIGDGTWTRYFVGTVRTVGDTEVMISGFQSTDGTITRSITVERSRGDLDAAQARQLAAALLDAADEIEALQ